MSDWIPLAGVVVTVIAMLFAFAKWFMDWAEKRDAEQEKHFSQRLNDHKEEFEKVHDRIDKHADDLNETREELISDYMKQQDFKSWRNELREDFKNVYQKLGGVDRALNQLVGLVKGKVGDE